VAVSDDDSRVVMVNPEDGSISVFNPALETLVSRTKTGGEPSSVVLSADGKSAYVANRADATVVRVDGLDGEQPTVGATLDVGSEPTGVALSPNGKRLFVAELAQSRVSVIDTAAMTVESREAPLRARRDQRRRRGRRRRAPRGARVLRRARGGW
jgi:DNA-binding beta-propeller fold protein YncE